MYELLSRLFCVRMCGCVCVWGCALGRRLNITFSMWRWNQESQLPGESHSITGFGCLGDKDPTFLLRCEVCHRVFGCWGVLGYMSVEGVGVRL